MVGLAVITVAIALLGGCRHRDDTLIQVGLNEQFTAHPLSITVEQIGTYGTDTYYSIPAINVTMTITNVAQVPVSLSDLDRMIALSNGMDTWRIVHGWFVLDDVTVDLLQPGLTASIVVQFGVPESADAALPVHLVLRTATWRQSSLDSSWGWFDIHDVAEVRP